MSTKEHIALVFAVLGGLGWLASVLIGDIHHNAERIDAVEKQAAVTGKLVERFHPTPLAE